jgi:hypothetical protein
LSLRNWAENAEPMTLTKNDPVITSVENWVQRTRFSDIDYLRTNYAAPGRWQRPLERDIRP